MFRNLINMLANHSDLGGCSACIVLKDYEETVYPEAHRHPAGAHRGRRNVTGTSRELLRRDAQNRRFARMTNSPTNFRVDNDSVFAVTRKVKFFSRCAASRFP